MHLIAIAALLFICGPFQWSGIPATSTEVVRAAPDAPGFTEAFIDRSTLEKLLSDKDCDTLRFYNARTSSTAPGSVMAIGVRKGGSEIDGKWFLDHPYQMYLSLEGSSVRMNGLGNVPAGKAAKNMNVPGSMQSYTADFKRSELRALLAKAEMMGLRISPELYDRQNSMKLHSVSFSGGKATDVGSGPGYELLSSEPCPALCGEPNFRINK